MYLKSLFLILVFSFNKASAVAVKQDKASIEKQLFALNKLGDAKLPGLKIHIWGKPAPAKSSFISLESPLQPVTAGRCDPKPVCIPNPLLTNQLASNQIIFPKCVNIHRCGGCCINNYECVATKIVNVNFKDAYIVDVSGNDLTFNEQFIVVKNETECDCQCPYQTDEDCRVINPKYIMDEFDCGCVCPEKLICSSLHQFDNTNCKCVCNKDKYSKLEANCLAIGLKWDEVNCKCISIFG